MPAQTCQPGSRQSLQALSPPMRRLEATVIANKQFASSLCGKKYKTKGETTKGFFAEQKGENQVFHTEQRIFFEPNPVPTVGNPGLRKLISELLQSSTPTLPIQVCLLGRLHAAVHTGGVLESTLKGSDGALRLSFAEWQALFQFRCGCSFGRGCRCSGCGQVVLKHRTTAGEK